jgi:hypothetical protein
MKSAGAILLIGALLALSPAVRADETADDEIRQLRAQVELQKAQIDVLGKKVQALEKERDLLQRQLDAGSSASQPASQPATRPAPEPPASGKGFVEPLGVGDVDVVTTIDVVHVVDGRNAVGRIQVALPPKPAPPPTPAAAGARPAAPPAPAVETKDELVWMTDMNTSEMIDGQKATVNKVFEVVDRRDYADPNDPNAAPILLPVIHPTTKPVPSKASPKPPPPPPPPPAPPAVSPRPTTPGTGQPSGTARPRRGGNRTTTPPAGG